MLGRDINPRIKQTLHLRGVEPFVEEREAHTAYPHHRVLLMEVLNHPCLILVLSLLRGGRQEFVHRCVKEPDRHRAITDGEEQFAKVLPLSQGKCSECCLLRLWIV